MNSPSIAKRILHFALAAALLLAILWRPASLLAAKQLLWKFAQGEEYRLTLAQQVDTETTIGAKSTTITMEMALDMDWRVVAASDASATITQKITRARLTIAAPAQETIHYDSAAQDKPAGAARSVAAALRPLLDAELVLTMNNLGQVSDAALSAETAAALEQAAAAPEIKQLFSQQQLNKTLRQAALLLPQQPVDVGDTWQTETELPSALGALKQTTTFTLLGAEERDGRQVEKIGIQSQLEVADAKPDGRTNQKLIEHNQSGAAYFDARAGRLVAAEMTQSTLTETPYRDLVIRVQVDGRSQVRLAAASEDDAE